MSPTRESRTIGVRIERPAAEVYDFVADVENLPRWASGLGKSFRREGDVLVAETDGGTVRIRFVERNSFGVLDHYVTVPSGGELTMPMRVVANGDGSELLFTLVRQPQMTDEQFAADADWIRRDLETLKQLLEGR